MRRSAGCGGTAMRCGWKKNCGRSWRTSEAGPAKPRLPLTGMPGGKSLNDKIPAAVERILALQDELLKQVDECNSCRKDVGLVIDAIEDTRLQTIFRYRYIFENMGSYRRKLKFIFKMGEKVT